MKNILLIIHKLNGGGAERCVSNLSIEMSKHFNVYLAVFDSKNITYPYGGKLIDLAVPSAENPISQIWNFVKRIYKVRMLKKKFNIYCSISFLDGPNNVNIFSQKGERIIVSVRNCLSKERVGMVRKWLIQYVSKKADLTVALSEYVKHDLNKKFNINNDKIQTIYNHCDENLLNSLIDQNLNIDSDLFNFVTMGRLHYQKGQWHLIKAFSLVVKKYPNTRLIILGEGAYMGRLKKLALDLKIEDKVNFLGYLKHPHIYLKKSDVFVFPSLYEGLGNVLLEALAFNLPIISTDCEAGPREILAPGTNIFSFCNTPEYAKYGILIPNFDEIEDFSIKLCDNEKVLADIMIKLIEDDELRLKYSSLAKERIRDFDKDKIMSQWISAIYGKLDI